MSKFLIRNPPKYFYQLVYKANIRIGNASKLVNLHWSLLLQRRISYALKNVDLFSYIVDIPTLRYLPKFGPSQVVEGFC